MRKWFDFFFYGAERVGKHGRTFTMLKIRTMCMGADKMGGPSVAADDLRVTRIGRCLRKCHLDELPQIINILKGDMAIVGPRPEVPYYVKKMNPHVREIILSVRPGLIDYASLWFYNEGELLAGRKNPEAYYEKEIWPVKMQLAIAYVMEKSLWTDIKIITLFIGQCCGFVDSRNALEKKFLRVR